MRALRALRGVRAGWALRTGRGCWSQRRTIWTNREGGSILMLRQNRHVAGSQTEADAVATLTPQSHRVDPSAQSSLGPFKRAGIRRTGCGTARVRRFAADFSSGSPQEAKVILRSRHNDSDPLFFGRQLEPVRQSDGHFMEGAFDSRTIFNSQNTQVHQHHALFSLILSQYTRSSPVTSPDVIVQTCARRSQSN